LVTPALEERIMDEVMYPVVEGLAAERIPYRGLLYAGLMIHEGEPKVLEFNVRFGDPECQVLMARLRSDLIDLIEAVLDGFLVGCTPRWDPRPAACVVMAAEGYPAAPVTGTPIRGLDALADWRDGVVFHAGTTHRDGAVVSSGGRVLTVTALGDDLAAAVAHAYDGVGRLAFAGAHYRHDIGHRALGRAS
jgi:phosphoribosylamine--glycine ligase